MYGRSVHLVLPYHQLNLRVAASPLKIPGSHTTCKAGQGIKAVPCLRACSDPAAWQYPQCDRGEQELFPSVCVLPEKTKGILPLSQNFSVCSNLSSLRFFLGGVQRETGSSAVLWQGVHFCILLAIPTSHTQPQSLGWSRWLCFFFLLSVTMT